MAYGTLASYDTLASSQQSVTEFGEDRAFEAIDALLMAHNTIMREQLSSFCEFTTDQLRRYGGPDNMAMDEVDEFGRADAQKIAAGLTVGFPMRLAQITLQWTRKYFQNTTAAELAAQATGMTTAHRVRVQRDLKRAIFYPTNTTFVDRLVDGVSLPVKALVNADSAAIPVGPNGEIYDASTHTHYLARAGGSLAASDITGALETNREHYTSGAQMLYINRAQEAAVRAMTSNFVPYTDARIINGTNADHASGTLDQSNLYNRAIGLFDGAEVWVKPWIPANYMFAWLMGAPKPLVVRERRPGSWNLVVAAEDEQYPLRARFAEAEYGVSVWNRTNGAVLYTANTTYTAPTIN